MKFHNSLKWSGSLYNKITFTKTTNTPYFCKTLAMFPEAESKSNISDDFSIYDLLKSEEVKDAQKNSNNNNRILRRQKRRKTPKKLDVALINAALSSVEAKTEIVSPTIKPISPSFVPSYVRAVKGQSNKKSEYTSRTNGSTIGSRRSRKSIKSSDPLRSNNRGNKCKLKRSRVQLKGFDKRNINVQEKRPEVSTTKNEDFKKVHVRAAVAAMEARISSGAGIASGSPRPIKPLKPAGLAGKGYGQFNKGGLSSNNATNDEKGNSVQKRKNMWEKSSHADKETNSLDRPHIKNTKPVPPEKPRSNMTDQRVKSSLYNNSNVSTPAKCDFTQHEQTESKPAIPAVPPKPRKPKPHSRENVDSSETTGTNHATNDTMPSARKTSVNDKARMFGGARTPLTNQDSKQPAGYDSPPLVRHRTSGIEESLQKFNENKASSNRRTSDTPPAVRQRNESENTNGFKNRWKKFEEEEEVKSRLSTNRSIPSDNEENPSTFLYNSISSSREDFSKKDNLIAQKSALFSAKTPPSTPPKPSPKLKPKISKEQNGDPHRISSSLQNSIEKNSFEPSKPRKKISLPDSESDPPKRFVNEVKTNSLKRNFPQRSSASSSPETRHRSSTDSSSGQPSPDFPRKISNSYLAKRTGSSEWSHNDQGSTHSSPRSSRVDKPSPQVLPKPKRPAPVAPNKRAPPSLPPLPPPSTERTSSMSSDTSTRSDLNPLELYAKVEKALSSEAAARIEPTTDAESQIRTRPDSAASLVSTDSGIRTSLEIPGRGPNPDVSSDFEHSDGDDSLIGHSRNNEKDETCAKKKETTETKLHNIAKELLSTEESYVSVLHLIDQVFYKQVAEAAAQKLIPMPEQIVNNIFCNVTAIYQFHSSFLLPQLKDRLANWETKPRLGDIMTKAGPFLKMYSLYVQNFDEAMNTIKVWSEKSTAFTAIMQNIQNTPECNSLTLQHHMLGPVQRVPRYRMLLEDYVKRLPQDSEDREEAEKALQLITKAATHSNETMKNIEKFHKLVNIFNNLTDVNFDIVDVSRELVKEGKIIKISARNGEKSERYIYLFSDMLLCCTPLRIPLQGKTHKISARIDLERMQISEVKNPTVAYAFCVNGMQKSIEFATNTAEEKETWVDTIQNAIDLREKNRQTFIQHGSGAEHSLVENISLASYEPPPGSPLNTSAHRAPEDHITPDEELGKWAPRWVKDNEVTMCQICSKSFNKITRRRHHCRACGRVVCSECSEHKLTLQYEREKAQKVCTRCYGVLTGRRISDDSNTGKKGGVLAVGASTVHSVIEDYLFFCETDRKKTWVKTWCVIPQKELCLYFYGAHQDIKALMTLPLPGYEVYEFESSEHKKAFRLKQGRKTYYFASDDVDSIERWKYALGLASVGSDLTRDDVMRLGKTPNVSGSEESEEEWD